MTSKKIKQYVTKDERTEEIERWRGPEQSPFYDDILISYIAINSVLHWWHDVRKHTAAVSIFCKIVSSEVMSGPIYMHVDKGEICCYGGGMELFLFKYLLLSKMHTERKRYELQPSKWLSKRWNSSQAPTKDEGDRRINDEEEVTKINENEKASATDRTVTIIRAYSNW